MAIQINKKPVADRRTVAITPHLHAKLKRLQLRSGKPLYELTNELLAKALKEIEIVAQ